MKLTNTMILSALTGSGRSGSGNILAAALQASTNSTKTFRTMPDVARWIHRKMVTNPMTTEAQEMIKLWTTAKAKFQASLVGDGAPMNNIIGLATGQTPEQFAAEQEAIAAVAHIYTKWINLVMPHGQWDYKNHGGSKGIKDSKVWIYDPVSKLRYRRDLWGNVHFGFVGRAVGFSGFTLTKGGGLAQLLFDTYKGRFKQVEEGYERYKKQKAGGSNNLTHPTTSRLFHLASIYMTHSAQD